MIGNIRQKYDKKTTGCSNLSYANIFKFQYFRHGLLYINIALHCLFAVCFMTAVPKLLWLQSKFQLKDQMYNQHLKSINL